MSADVTGPGGPEDVQAPAGGNGFDAPWSETSEEAAPEGAGTEGAGAGGAGTEEPGAGGPDGAAAARAQGNGHPAPVTAVPGVPAALRGRWIVPLAVVSAMTGMMLTVGAIVGTKIGPLFGLRDFPPLLKAALPGAFFGGVAGVWGGAWLAVRITGERSRRRLLLTGAGGTAGLVGGVLLAFVAVRIALSPLVPLGFLAPGFGAAIGDRIALRRDLAARKA